MEDYIGLANSYSIKGSEAEQFLFDLRKGTKYILNRDQFEFLSLCDGTKTLTEITRQYDSESQQIILGLLDNLEVIKAIEFSSGKNYRKLSAQLVPSIRLQAVHFEATSRCNMRCAHCYQGNSYLFAPDDLIFKEVESLADEMQELQVENVSLSGGEPLMRSDLFDMIHVFEEREMRVNSLFTNALLIDEKVIQEILNCRSNCTLFVSLDAITAEGMEFRGFNIEQGGYVLNEIMSNIKSLIASNIPVVINTVMTKYNIQSLRKMYEVIQRLDIDSWRIGFPKQTGFFKKNSKFAVSWDNMAEACFSLLEHHLNQEQPFHLQIEYLFRKELFENFQPLPDDAFVCDYEGRREGCCIKPNGDVASCAYCTDFPLGNIREKPLEEIWYSSKMQEIKNIRIRDVQACKNCTLRSYCATGCRINAYFLHGDFCHSVDDYACKAVKFFVEKVMPLLKEKDVLN